MLTWFRRQLAALAVQGLPASMSISRADVNQSDTVVIETDDQLSAPQVKRISEAVHGAFPWSKVLILDRGMKLRIARERVQ